MAVLESVVVFLLSSGIEAMVAIGRAALGLLKSKTGSTLAKAGSAAFVVLFASNTTNVFRVQKRIAKMGASQADQSIIRSQLLEITLIGTPKSFPSSPSISYSPELQPWIIFSQFQD